MRAHEFITENIINYKHTALPDTNTLYDVAISNPTATKVTTLSNGMDVYQQSSTDGVIYFITVNDEPVSKMHLNPMQIVGKTYDNIYVIYVIPKYRRTKMVFHLLTIAKHYKNHPLIIEGVLLKDGVSLVRSLMKSRYFTVKLMDMITGQISPVADDSIRTQLDMCYLIE
jgi:hypothetical protein